MFLLAGSLGFCMLPNNEANWGMMMRKGCFLGFFILLFSVCGFAKPSELTPKEAKSRIEEILKAHVSYHELNFELVKRTFHNYLDQLDPTKTYLLHSEVVKWLEPSEEILQGVVEDYKKADFTIFETIHKLMIPAIKRRAQLEGEIEKKPLPKNVQPSEFKDLTWSTSEDGLRERIARIKALQMDAAEKINEETKIQFLKRLEKRRLNREEELLSDSDPKSLQKVVLTLVLKALSSGLDSQTAYFTPAEANQFMIQVQQKLSGVGAQLKDDLNGFTIMRLLDGGPAIAAGKLKQGDKIIAVNHQPVVGMDLNEAVELIRGPQGTPVLLTILRETGEEKKIEKLDLELIRGEIVLKETRLETQTEPFGDGVIGVLHLFSFYQDINSSSATDLYQAIQGLKKEKKLKGIVLDLRDNAGGLLPQAVLVSGLFIKRGIVVSVKDNTGQIHHLRNIDGKLAWDGPLVVLTNRASASAAEIVAQTLQDYGRAIVVGDDVTYGKGTFQTFTLEASNYGKVNPRGEFKVTRGKYYTVSGKSPQLVGVKSDIVTPGIYSEIEIGEKFSKYPLENDRIPPNFEDNLADIPAIHRDQILRLYKFNLQPILKKYNSHISTLRQNSENRVKGNKNYQNFLKELSNKDLLSDSKENFGQNDLQHIEAINVMKDLIFLITEAEKSEKEAA
ncbi:MAG: S41 family peptidase [Chlamydiae bacterium]|nr:S41 family peptidase [Chlamydiota bacterium]